MNYLYPTPERALSLNYARVAASSLHPAIKRVCARIQEVLYVTVGEFLKGLSDAELTEIEALCDTVHNNDLDDPKLARASAQVEALTIALMSAECSVLPVLHEVRRCSQLLMTFVGLESLHRDGELELHHNQLAFVASTDTVIGVTTACD